MNISKKTGILLFALAFIAGGIGMIANQSKAAKVTPEATSISVNDVEKEDKNDMADEPIVGSASISESKALEIADKAYTGSGKITQTELEMEDGVLVYAVEFTESDGNEIDVKIDAKTGALVKIESDKTETDGEDKD